MSPCFPRHDITDRELAHAELGREYTLEARPRAVLRADLAYLRPRESRLHVALATRAAPFHHHVVKIVGGCAKKQMIRAHAQTPIAAVTDTQAIRNGAIGEFVGEPMGCDGSRIDSASAVTHHCDATRPKPAATGTSDTTVKISNGVGWTTSKTVEIMRPSHGHIIDITASQERNNI